MASRMTKDIWRGDVIAVSNDLLGQVITEELAQVFSGQAEPSTMEITKVCMTTKSVTFGRPKLTHEQLLIEELNSLSEMLNVLTPQQLEDVPRVRSVFRYLMRRKLKAKTELKNLKAQDGKAD